jgi:hypothetical protein
MGAANYPTSVWDGTSDSRPDADVFRAPDADDMEQLRNEILALQNQLKPLWIGADGTFRTTVGAGTDEVQSLAAIASTSGNWTLTITLTGKDPFTTASIAFNASAATIETAIDTAATTASVPNWTNGDISASGGPINSGAVTLTFDGSSVDIQPHILCTTADVDLNDSTPPVVSETTNGILPTADPTTTWWKNTATVTVG